MTNKQKFTSLSLSMLVISLYFLPSKTNIFQAPRVLCEINEVPDTKKQKLGIKKQNPIDQKIEAPQPKSIEFKLKPGQTIGRMLTKIGADSKETDLALRALNPVCGLKRIPSQQSFKINMVDQSIQSIRFYIPDRGFFTLDRQENGHFKATKHTIEPQLQRVEGVIQTSLYRSLKSLNLSPKAMREAVQALSGAVNMKTVKKGDRFVLLTEAYKDPNGELLTQGGVCALALKGTKGSNTVYRFKDSSGHMSFYNNQGAAIENSFLVMPVDTRRMRISSKFGLRMHPIRGYTAQHQGIDLAAPHGTPVMSAADGVVVSAYYYSNYGNYVKIRHRGGIMTVYAHLSKMNVRPGQMVKQRQVIGAVGRTGSATGPHLHHEVLCNNKHINPQSVHCLPIQKLCKNDLNKFRSNCKRLDGVIKL